MNSQDFYLSVLADIVKRVKAQLEGAGEKYTEAYKLDPYDGQADLAPTLRRLVRVLECEAPQHLSPDMYFALSLIRDRFDTGLMPAVCRLARALSCAPYALQADYAKIFVTAWVYAGGQIEDLRVTSLDARIAARLDSGDMVLCVESYHIGERTHCRSVLATMMASDPNLEERFGPIMAGGMVYVASYPDLPMPDFFASFDVQLADIRARASEANKAE